jgi:hypothetical protein
MGGTAMSETKHTPGPWYWCDGEDEDDMSYLTSASGQICSFGKFGEYYPQCGDEPCEADRNLIAAAPELLEAATNALWWWDGGNKISPKASDCIARLRAAIAKAKGEGL